MLSTLLPDSRNAKLGLGLASVCVVIGILVGIYAAHSGAGAAAAAVFGALVSILGFVMFCTALAMLCAAWATLVMAYATLAYLCGRPVLSREAFLGYWRLFVSSVVFFLA
jgi:hypothetical protein